MLNMRFHIHPDAEHQQANPESDNCASRKPSPLLAKRETKSKRSQSDSQHRCSNQIESLMLVPSRSLFAIKGKRGVEDEHTDWYVDIKNPAPCQELRNESSNSRTCGHAK